MINRNLIFLFLLLIGSAPLLGQPTPDQFSTDSPQEQHLIEEWLKTGTLPYDLTTSILIAEDADSLQIEQFKLEMTRIFNPLDKKIKSKDSPTAAGEKIFRILHDQLLQKYDQYATLSGVFETHTFNCLTGTTLFYLMGNHYNVPITLYTTPNHVYAMVEDRVRVEMTDPENGFDCVCDDMSQIDNLLRYKLITPEELQLKGREELYREYIENKRQIPPVSLLAQTYSNRAIDQLNEDQSSAALATLEKALLFDPADENHQVLYQTALGLEAVRMADTKDFSRLEDVLQSPSLMQVEPAYTFAIILALTGKALDFYSQRGDFAQGQAIVDLIKNRFWVTRYSEIITYEAFLYYHWALYLERRGDYNVAREKIQQALDLAPEEIQIKTAFVSITCHYAAYIAARGQSEAALALADSILTEFADFPVARETYVDVTINYVFENGLFRSDPARAKAMLLQAHPLDPLNIRLREMLAESYHRLAMIELRQNLPENLQRGKQIVEEGMAIVDNHPILLDDLKTFQQQLEGYHH